LLQLSLFHDESGQVHVTRGQVGPIDLTNQRHYYYVCLACFVLVAVALARLRKTGIGRAIVAVRENEAAASASTLSPANIKLIAFGLSGAVAGLAGALFGGLFVNLYVNTDFGPDRSVVLVTMAIIGGVGSVTGSVLGALYLIGVPNLFAGSTIASVLTSGLGLLVLVLWLPGGLLEVVHRARNAILERVAGRASTASVAPVDNGMPEVAAAGTSLRTFSVRARELPTSADPAKPVLSCLEVSVRFGGLVANRDVSLDVAQGETVGLIGTNGAGKSTLMNAVGGYVPVASGRIEVFGLDVTTWPAHARAELGMGRVFQDARLFGELTVHECVMVALEARQRSELLPSLLGLPPAVRAEAVKRSVADDVTELCGLGRYANVFVAELSTGTRRICEVALMLAGGSRLLMLDEPTAGIAQREVEAFGAVIVDVRRQLDASVLLIEHDIPLVMSLCDRIVCMTAGEVIASGSPEQIRNDPNVIAAYLGTDERAIRRSDMVKAHDR
jgi:ABC-type branched-subunit amino acid transport system ATPase component